MAKVKRFFNEYMGDVMLAWFAFLWLYVLLRLTTIDYYYLFEHNQFILYTEIALCAGATIWAVARIVKRLRRNKE